MSGYSKREKELSPQEAIAIAKQELAPYWFGSEPLLIGLDQGGQDQVFPLDREFAKQLWLIVVVDPTTFWGNSVSEVIQELENRYRVLSLNVLIVYAVRYGFQKNIQFARQWVPEVSTTSVRCFDVNSRLVSGFHATEFPKVLLFQDGKRLFEVSGAKWISETDEQIQKALRMNDPGLPLAPVLTHIDGVVYDTVAVNLTTNSPSPPGFQLMGNWNYEDEKIWTEDPEAKLVFRSPSSEVAIIARPREDSEIAPSFIVELNDLPPYDAVRGSSLRMSDSSELMVQVKGASLYSLLTGIPTTERSVTLRFTNVKKTAIEIYGVRFGERMKGKL